MDYFKIVFPRLVVKNKMVSSLGQFPITLNGMITHGHGNATFDQYSNNFWPNDPNFTIGSLLQLILTLEKELVN
jgi:hypothetical protein